MFILTDTEKEFVPTSEKEADNPLTFVIIPPTRRTVLHLQEKLVSSLDDDGELNPKNIPLADLMDLYFDDCVIGWKNMMDASNNPVIFSKELFKKFNDGEILNELYTEIKGLSESDPLV